MDAPDCHQRAHAGSSSQDQLLLNGLVLLPTSRENGNTWLQSFLIPNNPSNSVIDLSPNKDPVSLYNMASGTSATRAMVAPPTPASIKKNKCGNLKEYIPPEISYLNSELPVNPLEDRVPNGVQPAQVVTSLNIETEVDNVVNVDPSECFEREKQDTDLNRTPSQKLRKKKHRHKVITEAKVAKTPKKMILETTENSRVKRTHVRKPKEDNPLQSPGKRKYTRKKKEANPQPNPGSVFEEQNVTDLNGFCRYQSVKRRLNFDLNKRQTKKLNAQVNESSEAVKDVLSTQIPPSTHSSTNENVNERVRAPETPSQPQQLSKLELPNRKRRKEFASMVFNMKSRKEGENLNGNDYEIVCLNTDRGQTQGFQVVPENVSCGTKARAVALTASEGKPKSTKRKRKEHNQLASSIAEDTKRMELIIESVVSKLACLNINEAHENVPFVCGGVMVPCSGPPEIRKTKKPRAKDDLDDESERVWNLLMGKQSNVGEGTDADVEQWWENERQVFLGRTASFTARMHLIQGNRKFSPWKGSVVDSVIGVFLTQNVSDHLSSSVFMSLAARFPVRPNSSYTATNVKTPAGSIVTEPNIHDQNLPGVYGSKQSYSTQSSFSDRGVGHHESPDTVLGSTVTSCANTIEGEEDKFRPVEDVVSSQYSSSFISFTQLLHMANNGALYAPNVTVDKSSDECGGGIDWPTLPRSNEVPNPSKKPDLTNQRPLNNKSRKKNKYSEAKKAAEYDWDSLRRQVFENGFSAERSCDAMDSMDYNALRNADVSEISKAIQDRGMHNLLAKRIKAFLDRLARDHGSIDLEWLKHVSPDKAKEYLLSIDGLGLKSVECIRLLTLHQLAFPVDTNIARIAVRLGWVPLQPLHESLQLHLLERYPLMENIQQYLWPRLYKLDQAMLYELHYQLITFGKVFCSKSKPNCNACPMRAECRHFASAYASARLALPGPEEKRIVNSYIPLCSEQRNAPIADTLPFPQLMGPAESQMEINNTRNYEPIIEEPSSPEPESVKTTILDIEEDYYNDTDEMPTIKLNFKEFTENLQSYMHENSMQLQRGNFSNALVAISSEAASLPPPKLKNVSRLRTEHQAYELPDGHPLLEGFDNREPDDPCKYLLVIWTPGETAESTKDPKSCCDLQDSCKMCGLETCFSCNRKTEAESQTIRGTILIPCRTANKGSFPLNGTYFQVNEVFADHHSSRYPIDVPRELIWNLKRRTVYFGTSIPSIFKGLNVDEIQQCFCRGLVCVRGFDRSTRAPKPLYSRLHFSASKVARTKKAGAKTAEAVSAKNTEQKSRSVKSRRSKNSSEKTKKKQSRD